MHTPKSDRRSFLASALAVPLAGAAASIVAADQPSEVQSHQPPLSPQMQLFVLATQLGLTVEIDHWYGVDIVNRETGERRRTGTRTWHGDDSSTFSAHLNEDDAALCARAINRKLVKRNAPNYSAEVVGPFVRVVAYSNEGGAVAQIGGAA